MSLRGIHIANEKRRNAEVAFESQIVFRKIRTVLKNGKKKQNVRFLKSTAEMGEEALNQRFGSWEEVAQALIDNDPELDTEIIGKKLKHIRRLWVDGQNKIAYRVNLYRTIFNPDGSEREQQDINKLPGNINKDFPLRWTGRMFPRDAIIRRFVFTKSYQLRHINGATFDFLYAMAEELDRQDSMVMLGGGKKGNEPILLTRGGQPYRGFLEGRIKEDRYMLILHLTDIELKAPEDEDI